MDNKKQTYINRVIRTYTSDTYSDRVVKAVGRWLNNGRDTEAKDNAPSEQWADCAKASEEEADNTETAYQRWSARQRMSQAVSDLHSRSKRILRLWQGIAALLVLALAVVTAYLTRTERPTELLQAYSPPGQMTQLALADGSEVMLNGATTLIYPDQFLTDQREVVLIGEANFKVKADPKHPFVVKTDGVKVTALGTEFNVKAYAHNPKVESTLLQGSVKVNYGDDGETMLHPSEQLVYDRITKEATVEHPYLNDITAWQSGELAFNNATLNEIFNSLDAQFPQRFVFTPSELPTERYTFIFAKGTPLQQVMTVICDVAGTIQANVDAEQCSITTKATR